jgi:transcriptional regulator with XRE-family HTH domain
MHAAALVDALKRTLKGKGLTYADLAQGMNLSEASVKRIFSRGDFTLQRLEEVCRIARIDFAELAAAASDETQGVAHLTLEQEKAIVSDPKLLLVAWCAVNNWTFEQIVANYDLTEPDCIRCLVRLDRLKIIELLPGNRIRTLVSRAFAWRPDGPIQRYFRERIEAEYLGSTFDRSDELFLFLSGMLSNASISELLGELRRVARDFAQRHRADIGLPLPQRYGTSLLIAMRPWELRAFRNLRREGAMPGPAERLLTLHQGGDGRIRQHRG